MNAESCGYVVSFMRTTWIRRFLQLIKIQRECVTGRTRVWHIIGDVSTYGTIDVRVDKRGSWKEPLRHFHRECGLCGADFARVFVVTSGKGNCTLTRLLKTVEFGTSFSCDDYCGNRQDQTVQLTRVHTHLVCLSISEKGGLFITECTLG